VGGKPGKVQEARQRLEDRIRKERRDIMMAEMRKPLVSTPARKYWRKYSFANRFQATIILNQQGGREERIHG
jgi:hypothetical protein